MFEVTAAETIALAGEQGLRPLHNSTRGDVQGRADVSWDVLVFERPA
jgi:hypothetical protein